MRFPSRWEEPPASPGWPSERWVRGLGPALPQYQKGPSRGLFAACSPARHQAHLFGTQRCKLLYVATARGAGMILYVSALYVHDEASPAGRAVEIEVHVIVLNPTIGTSPLTNHEVVVAGDVAPTVSRREIADEQRQAEGTYVAAVIEAADASTRIPPGAHVGGIESRRCIGLRYDVAIEHNAYRHRHCTEARARRSRQSHVEVVQMIERVMSAFNAPARPPFPFRSVAPAKSRYLHPWPACRVHPANAGGPSP